MLQKNATIYQETVFTHLNKSIYISGEDIAFTSYVFDKNTNNFALQTTNLYATITDKNGKEIKSKLFKVNNGIANGSFKIDDTFKSGIYTVKTFTNWMLNFDAKNYHSEKIEIINPGLITPKKPYQASKIDVQFLPESGTFLTNVKNTVGIIAKDTLGYGVKNIKGTLFENNIKLTDFKLNNLGIGRLTFTPLPNKIYTAKVSFNDNTITKRVASNLKNSGVLIKVTKNEENAFISLVTNNTSLPRIKNKPFYFIINNNTTNKTKIEFDNETIITTKIPFLKLATGVNIVTVLDNNNKPVAERIFFNYYNLNIIDAQQAFVSQVKDSTEITLQFSGKNFANNNNVSISILPKTTRSYNKENNIISQTLLQPHLKSFVENGEHYFNKVTKQTMYDLDNLLITQGWSSFNWSLQNKNVSDFAYKFEKGISFRVNLTKTEEKSSYLIHHLKNHDGKILEFDEEIRSFQIPEIFPLKDEKLNISKFKKKGFLEEPNSTYVQFFPSAKAKLLKGNDVLISNNINFALENKLELYNFNQLNKSTLLDEVVVKTNLRKQRIEKIKKKSSGRVFFLDDKDRKRTLANFLNFKPGIKARDDFKNGKIYIINRFSIQDSRMAVYLDGLLMQDNTYLFNFTMNDIEYVEVDYQRNNEPFIYGTGGTVK
ncbi:MG2 domain-containing protein, partial [Polaribacter sp.]|uniref:MG2 domain-containing protein n=1 Tax=Polaribacter sp. TaxID=1920175 RepID=UPI003F6B69C6